MEQESLGELLQLFEPDCKATARGEVEVEGIAVTDILMIDFDAEGIVAKMSTVAIAVDIGGINAWVEKI